MSDVFVGRRGEDVCIELLGHCQHIVEARQVGKVTLCVHERILLSVGYDNVAHLCYSLMKEGPPDLTDRWGGSSFVRPHVQYMCMLVPFMTGVGTLSIACSSP